MIRNSAHQICTLFASLVYTSIDMLAFSMPFDPQTRSLVCCRVGLTALMFSDMLCKSVTLICFNTYGISITTLVLAKDAIWPSVNPCTITYLQHCLFDFPWRLLVIYNDGNTVLNTLQVYRVVILTKSTKDHSLWHWYLGTSSFGTLIKRCQLINYPILDLSNGFNKVLVIDTSLSLSRTWIN